MPSPSWVHKALYANRDTEVGLSTDPSFMKGGIFAEERSAAGMELGEASEVAEFSFVNREDREANGGCFDAGKSDDLFGFGVFEGDGLGGAVGKGEASLFDAIVEDVAFAGSSATVGDGDGVEFLGYGEKELEPFADTIVESAFTPCGDVAAIAGILGFVCFGPLGLERRGGVGDFVKDGDDFAKKTEGVFFFGEGEALCAALGIAVFLEDFDAQEGSFDRIGEAKKGVGSAILESDLVASGLCGGDAKIGGSDEAWCALFAAGEVFIGDVLELGGDLCGDGDAEEPTAFDELEANPFADATGAFVGDPDGIAEAIGEVLGSRAHGEASFFGIVAFGCDAIPSAAGGDTQDATGLIEGLVGSVVELVHGAPEEAVEVGGFVIVIDDHFEPGVGIHILEAELSPLTASGIGFFAFFRSGEGEDGV